MHLGWSRKYSQNPIICTPSLVNTKRYATKAPSVVRLRPHGPNCAVQTGDLGSRLAADKLHS